MTKNLNSFFNSNAKMSCCSLVAAFFLLASSAVEALPVYSAEVAGSDTSTIGSPTISYGKPNQSRNWYNSYQNRWDALIPKLDGSSSDRFIMKDVAGVQLFTDVELEDRDYGRSDVFWDESNKRLFVLSSHRKQSQLWQVSYDDSADSYSIAVGESGTGIDVFGIAHPNDSWGGNSPATLYVSPNGDVWVSVLKDGELLVQHSTDGGATWMMAPVNLNDPADIVKEGVTTWNQFEYNGATYVGLFAGENGEGSGGDSEFFYFYINQADDPSVLANWVDDSVNLPAAFGDEKSDDHVSAALDADGNQYFAVKTEGGNTTDPLIKLYKRTPAGLWSQYKVTETQEDPEESRPSLVIDDENEVLYVFTNGAEAVGDNEREGSYISAPLAALESLENESFTRIFSEPGTVFTDLTTPKHSVDSSSGLVVLAHNRNDETVWYSTIEIQPAPVEVPNVVGRYLSRAKSRIINAGLKVGNIKKVYSYRVSRGRVISQDPVNTSLAPGTSVDLVVSLGSRYSSRYYYYNYYYSYNSYYNNYYYNYYSAFSNYYRYY